MEAGDAVFEKLPEDQDLPAVGWLSIDEKCRFRRRDGDRAYLYLTNGVVVAFRIKKTENGEEWYIVGGVDIHRGTEVKIAGAGG